MSNYQIRGDVVISTPQWILRGLLTSLINSQCHYLINMLHGTYSRYSSLTGGEVEIDDVAAAHCVDGGCH